MQTVSENWAGIRAGEHIVNFKMVIAGETYTYADIASGSIHLSLMETLSLGNTDCGTIEVTFKPRGTIPTMARIDCSAQISNGSQVSDWLPFGVFYIDTRKTDAFGWMTITGFDAMLMCEQLYLDNEGQYPMAMADAVAFIAGLIGVEVDQRSAIADYTIDYPAEIYTLREVLGGIGAASGGSWCISPAGKLWLVPLSSPSAAEETPCGSCDILEGGLVTISRVTLYPDDGTKRTAGNDTGYEITGNCAYATDEMCAALLAKLQNVIYLPLEADQVLIDPAMELGDSICVGGNLTILGQINYTLGKGMAAHVAAPIDSEINHEYPYGQSGSRTERQLAQAYSTISKTTEEIRMEVNAADGRYTELATTVDGITGEVRGLEEDYAAFRLTVEGFWVDGPNGSTLIAGSLIDTSTLNVDNINIDLSGRIAFTDLTDYRSVQSDIDEAYDLAAEAWDMADSVQLPAYIKSTYIDFTKVQSPRIEANDIGLYGGYFEIYDGSGTTKYGSLGFGSGLTTAGGTTYGMVMSAAGNTNLGEEGNYFIATNAGVRMQSGGSKVYAVDGQAVMESHGNQIYVGPAGAYIKVGGVISAIGSGGGGTGATDPSGYMLASGYDPNGTVANAGGIVAYVGLQIGAALEASY